MEAQRNLYSLEWTRWGAYQLVDGWFYPADLRTGVYDPTQEKALPTELARVGHQDYHTIEKVLREFYRRFGFLGQSLLQGKPRKVVLEGTTQFADGDSLVWAIGHALNVSRCLALVGALKNGKRKKLQKILKWEETLQPEFVPGLPLHIPTLTGEGREIDVQTLFPSAMSDTEKAKALLAACLEPNLGNVTRVYDPKTGKSVFRFTALIQLIYWQIADWAGRERLRECEECHTYFFAHDGRQKRCPAPNGEKESRCAWRARQRKQRASKPKKRPHR